MKYALLKLTIKLKEDKVVNTTTAVWKCFDAEDIFDAEKQVKGNFSFSRDDSKYELYEGTGTWEYISEDESKDIEIIHQFRIVYMGENVTFRF